jgi:hypothetical protein
LFTALPRFCTRGREFFYDTPQIQKKEKALFLLSEYV